MSGYNVTRIAVGEQNIYCDDAITKPTCDAPYASHLGSASRTETWCLTNALRALQREYGKNLTNWDVVAGAPRSVAVGDFVAMIAIPSGSTLDSIGWEVTDPNGVLFDVTLQSGAALTGTGKAVTDCTSADITALTGLGGAARHGFVVPTAKPQNGLVDYVRLVVAALPTTFAACPKFPDVCLTVAYTNHILTHKRGV